MFFELVLAALLAAGPDPVLLERFLLTGSLDKEDFTSEASVAVEFAEASAERRGKHWAENKVMEFYNLEHHRERLRDWVNSKPAALSFLFGSLDLTHWNHGWRPTAEIVTTEFLEIKVSKDPFGQFAKASFIWQLDGLYLAVPVWRKDDEGKEIWQVLFSSELGGRDGERWQRRQERIVKRGQKKYGLARGNGDF